MRMNVLLNYYIANINLKRQRKSSKHLNHSAICSQIFQNTCHYGMVNMVSHATLKLCNCVIVVSGCLKKG